jgi:acyl carrier protein
MLHTTPDRVTLENLVIAALRDVIEQSDRPMPETLDATTSLIGHRAVLDSLALVTLIVDLEQRLEEEYELALTLADDRAMSQKNSPFRSVETLTGYICERIAEEQGNG